MSKQHRLRHNHHCYHDHECKKHKGKCAHMDPIQQQQQEQVVRQKCQDKLHKEIHNLNMEISRLYKIVQQKDLQIQNLHKKLLANKQKKQKNNNNIAIIQEWKNKYHTLQNECKRKFQKQIDDLSKSNQILKVKLKKALQDKLNQERNSDELKIQLTHFQKTLQQLKNDNIRRQKEHKQIKKRGEMIRKNQLGAEDLNWQDKLNLLQNQNNNIKIKERDSRKQIELLKGRIVDIEIINERLKNEINQLQKWKDRASTIQSSRQQIRLSRKSIQQQLQQMIQKKKLLQTKVYKLEHRIRDLQQARQDYSKNQQQWMKQRDRLIIKLQNKQREKNDWRLKAGQGTGSQQIIEQLQRQIQFYKRKQRSTNKFGQSKNKDIDTDTRPFKQEKNYKQKDVQQKENKTKSRSPTKNQHIIDKQTQQIYGTNSFQKIVAELNAKIVRLIKQNNSLKQDVAKAKRDLVSLQNKKQIQSFNKKQVIRQSSPQIKKTVITQQKANKPKEQNTQSCKRCKQLATIIQKLNSQKTSIVQNQQYLNQQIIYLKQTIHHLTKTRDYLSDQNRRLVQQNIKCQTQYIKDFSQGNQYFK